MIRGLKAAAVLTNSAPPYYKIRYFNNNGEEKTIHCNTTIEELEFLWS